MVNKRLNVDCWLVERHAVWIITDDLGLTSKGSEETWHHNFVPPLMRVIKVEMYNKFWMVISREKINIRTSSERTTQVN